MKNNLLRKLIFLFIVSSQSVFYAHSQTPSTTPVKSGDAAAIHNSNYGANDGLISNHWFIAAAVGPEVYFGGHNRQVKFGERIAPGFSLSVGKWFGSGIGGRLVGYFGKSKGATQNGSHGTGVIYDASQRLEKQQFSYYQFRGDVLFNFSNHLSSINNQR